MKKILIEVPFIVLASVLSVIVQNYFGVTVEGSFVGRTAYLISVMLVGVIVVKAGQWFK